MTKVAIIGLGNAGNQVASRGATVYGIKGIAVNTSESDITTITGSINSIVIGDSKGAGKDRDIAKAFVRKHIKELFSQKEFVTVIEENDIIFTPASTGGGSGSALAPVLTDILKGMYPQKTFITIGIMPPMKESVAAQQNTIEYLKEIRNFPATYMLYDNGKFADRSRDEMMVTINDEILKDICVIRGDYQFETPYTSIDEKDLSKITETPGRLVVARASGFKEKDLDEKSIEDRLVEQLRNGGHAELDRDQIIKRLGIITNLSERINREFNPDIPQFKDVFGEPIEGFEHICVTGDNTPNGVYVMMSGLSMPDDRIQKIIQRIDDATAALSKTKESSVLDDADTNVIDSLRQNNNRDQVKLDTDQLDDVFNKYIK